ASALLAACPNATLLAHPRAAKNLIDPTKLIEGATAVYGAERFRTLYGDLAPIPAARVRTLADGESFELGGAQLTAWHTAGHAYHHFIVDDPATSTVFTGDTFGLVYPALQRHGRFALPSTSPTGFNADEARKSLAKVLSLGERWVCPTHFDAYADGATIAAQLGRFIDRAQAWVDVEVNGGDEAPAASLEQRLQAEWWAALAEEAPWLTPEDQKLLALDVELNAQGLAYVIRAQRAAKKQP
ncbi:MAG TPA: MBL fold metallo-hydrolase, partial [Polyangia bacterium]|nr:MBL fold metallo-hydrolase [Polyangia bacterium]